MKKVAIKSNLIGKNEAFKILALSTVCKMPLLINGEKGTAKTATVLDFAASLGYDKDESFIIELSEGTKVSHLLGQPDMRALMIDKDWKMHRPIAKAKTVIINEVDKASSGIRNAMLSIMAEKEIFDGGERVECNWETFVATSNEIPKGEETLPFWDRLVLRYEMQTVTNADKVRFMKDRSVKDVMTINMPTLEQIYSADCNYEYIEKMLDLIEHHKLNISDRTKTKLDVLVKAAMIVYEMNEEDSVIKIAELIAAPIVGDLGKSLLPIEISNFKSSLEMFNQATKSGANGNRVGMLTAYSQLQSALKLIDRNPKLKNKYYNEYSALVDNCLTTMEMSNPQMEENPF